VTGKRETGRERERERERGRDPARRPYWRNSRGRDPINNGATSRHVPAACRPVGGRGGGNARASRVGVYVTAVAAAAAAAAATAAAAAAATAAASSLAVAYTPRAFAAASLLPPSSLPPAPPPSTPPQAPASRVDVGHTCADVNSTATATATTTTTTTTTSKRRGCLLFRRKNRELSKEKRKRKKRSTASIKRIEGIGDDRSSRPPRRLKPLVFVHAAVAASLSGAATEAGFLSGEHRRRARFGRACIRTKLRRRI